MPAEGARAPQAARDAGLVVLAASTAAFGALAVLDLAGALALVVAHRPFRLDSLSAAGAALGSLVRHPGSPARAFGAGIGTAAYWGSAAALAAAALAGCCAALGWWRARAAGDGDGFASPAAVRAVASLQAARRKAAQTRPSLAAPARAGGARWSRLATREVGYPLGVTRRPRGVELVAHFETSLRLVAPPGEGKTKRVMEPVGSLHPGPLFATSTKSDLYESIVADRARIGRVWALDPDGLVPGAEPLRWSPVAGCASTRTADRRAGALLAAGADTGDVKNGEFFRESARAVLAALLHAAALGGATMADIVTWASDPGNPDPVRLLARHGAGRVDWAERLARHTTGSEVTTSGVMRTVDLALSCFQHDEVLDQCSPAPGEELDLAQVLRSNSTLFALGKDRPGGVAPLVTAFAEELLVVAEHEAVRSPARRLDPPLLCLLDEVPSIAPLPGLPALAADGRGRGIVVVYAMQSFSQAEWRWGAEGAETLANATTVTAVLGGLKVAEDLEELSRLCGTRRVVRRSSSSPDAASGGTTVSASWEDEPVLDAAAIRCLPEGVALVIWGRLPPMLVHLPGSWEGRRGRELAASEHVARAANDAARRRCEEGPR